ncbi:MAG: amidohydrolase [Candidatus Marinimicrobia bacterium]|nr:amidohydrolase [Candidatus Neomarinimicrobiota bacterium]
MSILIKNVLLDDTSTDVFIVENIIHQIGTDLNPATDHIIDGTDKAILPSFINAHTHSAMTHFRGFGDDMPLMEWLEKNIWPNEIRLNEELVYAGAKLACLEMIKSGITFFNDMYWFPRGVARAVSDIGMRALVNAVFIDLNDSEKAREQIAMNEELYYELKGRERIHVGLGPHAVYTVSESSLLWIKDFAETHDLMIHIHLSETEQEVQDWHDKHCVSPVEYLHRLGLLSPRLVTAHCVWVTDKDIDLLAANGVNVAHNPISNMKLSVNRHFPYTKFLDAGVNICLGTDGVGSNNNLSMFDTMKVAALLQKHHETPETLPATECFNMATINGYRCFDLPGGEVKEGMLADLILVDLNLPEMIPCHHLISNMVYSANASVVDTTICNGKILMQNRKVMGEEEIIYQARKTAKQFLG